MKQKRSLNLIANFVNGYADGWYFAVRECLKNELDIKYTERIEPVIIDGKIQHKIIIQNGKETKKPLTKKVMRWTQGSSFSFAEGHIFYDTPNAYLQWDEALKQINLICTVIRAVASRTDGEGIYSKGSVTFTLANPKSYLVPVFPPAGYPRQGELNSEIEKKMASGDMTQGEERIAYDTWIAALPTEEKYGIETIGQYHLNQEDFVKFLKSGDLKNLKDVKEE
jgi:hypothetical protein